MIYLDNAATTFPKPECVYVAMDRAQREHSFNIGRGSYKVASEALKYYDELKKELCQLVGILYRNEKVIITSSATIAANQLVHGLDIQSSDVVYYTPFEHNSVARPLEQLSKKKGFKLIQIPYNSNQDLEVDKYRHLLSVNPATHVFACHVSNVTGLIQDIKKIFDLAGENAISITDASQSIGLVEIDMIQMNVNYLLFAGHKTLYGPFGIGGIIRTDISVLKPLLYGGTGSDSLNVFQESDEIGSLNLPTIIGLLEGIRWVRRTGISTILEHERHLAHIFMSKLREIYGSKVFVNDSDSPRRTTGIVPFILEEYDSSELAIILSNESDIAVRAGYHCAPYIHDVLGSRDSGGVVRVSFSYFSTEDDVTIISNKLTEVV